MKLRAGILGYGNLGKSLEKEIVAREDFSLEAVFSRRNLDNKLFVPTKRLESYKDKLDVLFVALGSYKDIEQNVSYFSHFDTVDSFDTHAKMTEYKQLLTETKPDKLSVCAVGWDPGVLSIVRGIFSAGGGNVTTFWGKGISQGHSNALRAINGVLDAVEITLPNPDTVEKAKRGTYTEEKQRHHRECYVACVAADKKRVEEEIRAMPHYFAGQQVTVNFCTTSEIRRIKENCEHAGKIIVCGEGYSAETQLNVCCNTQFTAKIMLAYAKAVPQLKRDGYLGALDPFDIPLKYIADANLV